MTDSNLDNLFREINNTIAKLAKECEKPNFEQMQKLTIAFKNQIRKSKNYIKSQIDIADNLVPHKLQEYSEFTNGLLDAINYVCSDAYCPQYKKSDKAYKEICKDLKFILKVEVVNELDVLLPLSKMPSMSQSQIRSTGGKKKKSKQKRRKHKKKTRKKKGRGPVISRMLPAKKVAPEAAVMGEAEIHRKQQRLAYLNRKGRELQETIQQPPSPYVDIYAKQEEFNKLKNEWKLLMDEFPPAKPVHENVRAHNPPPRVTTIIDPQTKTSFSVQHGRRNNIITRNNRVVPNRIANRRRRRRRTRRNRVMPL